MYEQPSNSSLQRRVAHKGEDCLLLAPGEGGLFGVQGIVFGADDVQDLIDEADIFSPAFHLDSGFAEEIMNPCSGGCLSYMIGAIP